MITFRRLMSLCMFTAAAHLGCATTIAAKYPHLERRSVCLLPPGIEPDATEWIYTDNNTPISNFHPEVIYRIAPEARTVFTFDPHASPHSPIYLPAPHDELLCPRASWLPWREPEPSALKPDSFTFHVQDPDSGPCDDLRQAAGFLGQTLPKRHVTGGCMAPRQLNSRERAVRNVELQLKKLGADYGALFGEVEGGIASLNSVYQGTLSYQVKTGKADVLDDLYTWLAIKLEALPDLPTYDEQDFAEAAQRGFEAGFGAGFDAALSRAQAVNLAAETALALSGTMASLAQSAGAKTMKAALTRLRGMPMFVPGTVGGSGFFLRVQKALPKPPVANANAPSLKPGILPPAAAAPPPFGNLSRAAEFGVQTEGNLARAIAGTGLEKHHLIEQRFIYYLKGDPRMKLTIAVTAEEHQAFTNAWRQEIAYGPAGTGQVTTQKANDAARKIYAQYPAILKALGL